MASHESYVWLNGSLLPPDQARISPSDLGFTVGVGAFETLRAYDGHPFAITRHWRRLVQSCRVFDLAPPSLEMFRQAMSDILMANGLREARVRFTVSNGEAYHGAAKRSAQHPLVCTAVPFTPFSETENVATVPWPRNERGALAGAKTLSHGENIFAMEHARKAGAGEAIFANMRGELCEGSSTNLFLVHDNIVHTPPLSSGCLPGVTRELVIEQCETHGIPVSQAPIPISALSGAKEAFLTSSTREVQPIAAVDGTPLSETAGPFTRRVAGLFRTLVTSNADP